MNEMHNQRTEFASWPAVTPSTVFDYGFVAWPDEASPRIVANKAVFNLFQIMMSRVVMEFTERDFNDFREELSKLGITLREIERSPHLNSVAVH